MTITGSGFTPTQDITVYFGKNKAKPPVIKESGEIDARADLLVYGNAERAIVEIAHR